MNVDARPRVFAGNRRVDAIPADDRGLAYGDGLFETLRAHAGAFPWWDSHWRRLARGASRLGLALPDPVQVQAEAASLFEEGGDGVLKLLVTRGGSARGYAPPAAGEVHWILSRNPLPPSSTALRTTWCETRLAVQPALAGLKHCNRLEQVLARDECVRGGFDEGLMLDTEGTVVSATSGNLFVLRDGTWLTPAIDRCGVAGTCRAHLLVPLAARESRIDPAVVDAADAVFLCNAVRGILPVASLGSRRWAPHAALADAARALAASHPGFQRDVDAFLEQTAEAG